MHKKYFHIKFGFFLYAEMFQLLDSDKMKKAFLRKSKHVQVNASHYCPSEKPNLTSNSWKGSFDSRDIMIFPYTSSKSLWTLFSFIQHICLE